ncbi:MAG: energy transducer TonB [Chitinophagaceae bacterium]
MENNKILSAAFLDILFDGRNKDYGAYELRKSYNKRVATALVVTGSLLLLLFLGSALAKELNKNDIPEIEVAGDVVLDRVPIKPPVEPPAIPPPPHVTAPPPVEMKQFTPPLIMPDKEVPPQEKPPVNDELIDSKIGTANVDGIKDDGTLTTPPPEVGTGIAEAPKQVVEDYERIFIKVEEPATFKGGTDGWRRYLERNLSFPEAAQENGTAGVVKVQLVVDKNGKISEVTALNNPGDGLAEEAVRVIKSGPDWIPAQQNGRSVSFRFIQTITFASAN